MAEATVPPSFEEVERRPYLGLLKLAYPLIIAFSIQTGFNAVDTIFVGRLGSDAIAALSLAYPFQMIMYAIGGGLGIGAQSLIARAIGSRNPRDAEDASKHSLLLAVICGTLTALIGLSAAPLVIGSFGAPEGVNILSMDYLTVILGGSMFYFLMFSLDSILRGEGSTKRSMYFMASSAVLNIFLDPIFIFGLGMGVSGAAIATVLARAVVVVAMVYHIILRKRNVVKLHLRSFKYSGVIVRQIVGIGIPASLTQLSYSISLFAMNTILAFYGADAIAAFGIGFKIESLAFLPMFGMAGAFVSAVGYFKGSGQTSKILSLKNFAYLSTMVFMSACAVIFFVFPESIYRIFTDSAMVIDMGREYMMINVLVYPIVPLTSISVAGFQGLGRGNPPLLISLIRSWFVVIPLSWVFSFIMGYDISYIWWSMVAGNLTSAIIAGTWFHISTKKFRKEESGIL
ncbi:MAG TPA: MATE family efflux transporter [Candidatus Methanofastidiosa archaeon]|nr:MATE family efflux transporter [Candidatus Methanofastidiosa archaeon]